MINDSVARRCCRDDVGSAASAGAAARASANTASVFESLAFRRRQSSALMAPVWRPAFLAACAVSRTAWPRAPTAAAGRHPISGLFFDGEDFLSARTARAARSTASLVAARRI